MPWTYTQSRLLSCHDGSATRRPVVLQRRVCYVGCIKGQFSYCSVVQKQLWYIASPAISEAHLTTGSQLVSPTSWKIASYKSQLLPEALRPSLTVKGPKYPMALSSAGSKHELSCHNLGGGQGVVQALRQGSFEAAGGSPSWVSGWGDPFPKGLHDP